MADKARPFSIYLLRGGYDAGNALVDDHDLSPSAGDNLPAGASFFILDADRKRPWWRSYFGIQDDIWQELKGAILFLPVGERCFAICFGQVYHNLKDVAFEYDFGLRVTLNMLDPKELRSADMVEPGPARRKRMQVPISTDLTYLDFDANSEIIKSLTGKVKPEFDELFKSATGSASLKISLKIESEELPDRCQTFLELYESDEYKTAFPNIENITPVRNPADVAPLDALLLASLKAQDGAVTLTIPDIVDYKDNTCCTFAGAGPSQIYPDISLEQFYEYIDDDLAVLTIEELKGEYRLVLTDTEGNPDKSYGLYRSLIFDVEPEGEDAMYHLCEGAWYKVEKAFATRIRAYLDARCEPTDLAPYNHDVLSKGKLVYSEEAYNAAMGAGHERLICLDQKDISPTGATAIEPCDLYSTYEDASATSGRRAVFYHIKISTRSAHLSHLFNQGLASLELISHEPGSLEKLKALITAELAGADAAPFLIPLDHADYRVIFGIITHKAAAGNSGNLPLFSKLSLMRNMQRLDFASIPCALTFIPDQSAAKGGHTAYDSYLVEVIQDGKKRVVRVVDGQDMDVQKNIKRCPKEISDSEPGTRYNLSIKVKGDEYVTSHHWPYSLAA